MQATTVGRAGGSGGLQFLNGVGVSQMENCHNELISQ